MLLKAPDDKRAVLDELKRLAMAPPRGAAVRLKRESLQMKSVGCNPLGA
jgi:hypothetical protein